LASHSIKNFVKSHPALYSVWGSYKRILHPYVKILNKQFLKTIDSKMDEKKLMVNIGGGRFSRRHWRVMDFSHEHYSYKMGVVDYNYDLTSMLPFPLKDNQVSFFYSINTIEHIPQECCQHVFNEIFRCLKPSGAVRLVTPDFDIAKQAFLSNDPNFATKWYEGTIENRFLLTFAKYFTVVEKLSAEYIREKLKTMSFEELADWLTNRIPREVQKENPGWHINWWNFEKLNKMLKKSGFKNVYRSSPGESKFEEIRGGGDIRTAFDHNHGDISIFVEAVK